MTHPQLKRLKIHRYEEFIDVPWIEFSPHENVILGINGAGKTRLLQLINAVLNFDYTALMTQDFDVEFELVYPGNEGSEIRVFELRGRVRNELELAEQQLETDSPANLFVELESVGMIHRFSVHRDRNSSTLTYDGVESAVTLTPPAGNVIPWDTGADDVEGSLPKFKAFYSHEDDRGFQTLSANVRFQLRFHPNQRGRWSVTYKNSVGVPLSLLSSLTHDLKALKQPDKIREGLRLTPESSLQARFMNEEPSAALQPLLTALAAESLTFSPKVVHSTSELFDCEGFAIRLKFKSGAEYTDNSLTFGQRRFLLMALLLLLRPSYPALIDEIDNGLHPHLVEATLQLLAGRQSFLSSHNKLVIDYINYDSADDIRRKLHICRRDPTGRQTVDTLSEAVAQEVYEKVAVGIMHPSDVLLMEGLW